MKFLGMGGWEFVIILVVVLLIFGPKNLPKLGSAIGKTVSNLRAGMKDGKKKKDEADNVVKAEGEDGESAPSQAALEAAEDVEDESDASAAESSEPAEESKPKVRKVKRVAASEKKEEPVNVE